MNLQLGQQESNELSSLLEQAWICWLSWIYNGQQESNEIKVVFKEC